MKKVPLSRDSGKSCITIFALSNPLPFDPHNIPHSRNYYLHLMPNSLSRGYFLTRTQNNLKLLPPDYSDLESSLVWRNIHSQRDNEVSLVTQMVKNLPAVWETQVRLLSQEDPLEKGMATHPSILAWRIPCTEKPGGLQSVGSQRVGHDWATIALAFPFQRDDGYCISHPELPVLSVSLFSPLCPQRLSGNPSPRAALLFQLSRSSHGETPWSLPCTSRLMTIWDPNNWRKFIVRETET